MGWHSHVSVWPSPVPAGAPEGSARRTPPASGHVPSSLVPPPLVPEGLGRGAGLPSKQQARRVQLSRPQKPVASAGLKAGETEAAVPRAPPPRMCTPGAADDPPNAPRAAPPTCRLPEGPAWWASLSRGPGRLWAGRWPPGGAGEAQGRPQPQPPPRLPRGRVWPGRGLPAPTSCGPPRNGTGWWPGGGAPRRTSSNWAQPCHARRQPSGQRPPAAETEDREHPSPATALPAAQRGGGRGAPATAGAASRGLGGAPATAAPQTPRSL